MKSEIQLAFENCKKEKRPALVSYIVASDPSKKKSLEILKSLGKYADILELGFPHSTPIGDGGKIQTSSYRAIKNGFKMKDVFHIVKNFKKTIKKPIILMGYYNMIFQYGENNFLKDCKKAGVSGIICVDLPWPENQIFAKKCKKKSIVFVQLLSPTTTKDRMRKIIKNSHSMNYLISILGTTGSKLNVSPKKILKNYNDIKRINSKKNLVIGFGITNKTIKSFKSADGVVIGSTLCNAITNSIKNRQNPALMLNKMIKKLKRKIS
jgi:tryptophan synthase alpha chain|tara:strand:- start:504 stop:1301 length:798 start_codon:yes stop_codon:yes gene_type:complete